MAKYQCSAGCDFEWTPPNDPIQCPVCGGVTEGLPVNTVVLTEVENCKRCGEVERAGMMLNGLCENCQAEDERDANFQREVGYVFGAMLQGVDDAVAQKSLTPSGCDRDPSQVVFQFTTEDGGRFSVVIAWKMGHKGTVR
ncbi:MAG: hypothetical protein ACYTFI_28755 [Planctomycetota bacterium]|jgi:hypothetical protein